MPIITTPGQTTQPVQKQDTSATLPPRLQSAFTPTQVQPIVHTPPPPAPKITKTDDFDDDDDLNDDFEDIPAKPSQAGKTGLTLSRMSEEQRRTVITTVFTLVLGRNPTDRDFSYYRFSTLTEESLTKSLLNLPEHKKMVEKANEHTSLKQSVSSLDLQVKQLDATMQSMKQELVTMQQLLIEKNRYIQQMRGLPSVADTPPQPSSARPAAIPEAQTVQPPPPQKKPEYLAVETRKLPGPMDEIKNMFSGLFGKK